MVVRGTSRTVTKVGTKATKAAIAAAEAAYKALVTGFWNPQYAEYLLTNYGSELYGDEFAAAYNLLAEYKETTVLVPLPFG